MLQRFDGNLDRSTVMALQRFLNSTRDDIHTIDVNGEFSYNEETRYAFNEETNEALHEFLGLKPVEKETTKSLIVALRAYVNRRASWARGGRHSSLRMVLSKELLHLDITSDDFGPGFYNTNNASTKDVAVEMNPISTEELKENKLSLMYGLRRSQVLMKEGKEDEKTSRRESGGFPFVEPDCFSHRLQNAFDEHLRYKSHIQEEIRSRDEALAKEKKKSELLWEKLRNAQIADEEAEMRRCQEATEMKNVHRESLESVKQDMKTLREKMMSEQQESLETSKRLAESELEMAMRNLRETQDVEIRALKESHSVRVEELETSVRSNLEKEKDRLRQEHEDAIRAARSLHSKTLETHQEKSEILISKMREDHENRIRAEENKFNAQTKSSIREVESRLNLQHENEMKQAKMEHIRAMGVLREEHASELLKIQDSAESGEKKKEKKKSSGGLFSKLW